MWCGARIRERGSNGPDAVAVERFGDLRGRRSRRAVVALHELGVGLQLDVEGRFRHRVVSFLPADPRSSRQ